MQGTLYSQLSKLKVSGFYVCFSSADVPLFGPGNGLATSEAFFLFLAPMTKIRGRPPVGLGFLRLRLLRPAVKNGRLALLSAKIMERTLTQFSTSHSATHVTISISIGEIFP